MAARGVDHSTPTVLGDGGIEIFNRPVDEIINSGLLRRVLAGTEITYSKLMIESWWRVLKHQWLFLNALDRSCSTCCVNVAIVYPTTLPFVRHAFFVYPFNSNVRV